MLSNIINFRYLNQKLNNPTYNSSYVTRNIVDVIPSDDIIYAVIKKHSFMVGGL